MSSGTVWDVPCYVCGCKLGSNKVKCGQTSGKRHSRPPCVWAESDNTIVLLCQKKDAQRRASEQEQQRIYEEQQEKYKAGTLIESGHSFTHDRSDNEDFEITPHKVSAKRAATQQITSDRQTPKKRSTQRKLPTPAQLSAASDGSTTLFGDEEQNRALEVIQQRRRDEYDLSPERGEEGKEQPLNTNERGEEEKQEHQQTKEGGEEEKEDSRMVWRHESKMTLYGWVIKLNPFGCKRGTTDAAWKEVAMKCADSTKHVSKKNGKIDVSGHGLQVYVGGQLKEMKKKFGEESKESGQTGKLSDLERAEYDLLAQIYDRKREIKDSKEAEKGEKDLLDKIKADQLGEAIYHKAMQSEPVKNKYIKNLNRKRKTVQTRYEAIKSANKALNDEQCLNKLPAEDRDVLVMWAKAKKDGHAKSGRDNSDSDSSDDDGAGKGGKKKATVVDSIANMSSVGNMMIEALSKQSPLEMQMEEYYRRKATAMATVTVESRLARLKSALDNNVISVDEYDAQRARIIGDY